MKKLGTFAIVAVFILVVASASATAGTVSLAWDPVVHDDLAGYRVYYDTTPGAYGSSVDVGTQASATLTDLADCTDYQVAVKAYDSEGNESSVFSTPVSGWARPEVVGVSPAQLEANSSAQVVVSGANFMNGASVVLDHPGLSVDGVTWSSCGQLVVDVTIGSAAPGTVDVTVVNPDQVFGRAVSALAITSDSSGPEISGLGATPGATSAAVVWDTDEAADRAVFYRASGDGVWHAGPAESAPATAHSLTLEGLAPTTDYDYYVRSVDGSGNATTTSPATFTTGTSPYRYLRVEAETGDVDALSVRTGEASFADGFLENGTPDGSARYDFWLPTAGEWNVWARARGGWLERLDGATEAPFSAPSTGWSWVALRRYDTTAGLHSLVLEGQGNGAAVDRILITDDPDFVATEPPGADVTAPAAPAAFAAAADDESAALTWTMPSEPDAARIVVRVRTDGATPQSPIDGSPVLDQAAAPGASGTHDETGLDNGTSYRYAAFVIDASGNVSVAATATADPAAAPPPAVENLIRTDTM